MRMLSLKFVAFEVKIGKKVETKRSFFSNNFIRKLVIITIIDHSSHFSNQLNNFGCVEKGLRGQIDAMSKKMSAEAVDSREYKRVEQTDNRNYYE